VTGSIESRSERCLLVNCTITGYLFVFMLKNCMTLDMVLFEWLWKSILCILWPSAII